MDNLRKLQECNKRNLTFKQAFCQLGIEDDDKPLKELNEKGQFSALANWALNKLRPFHSMDLRCKVGDEMYEIYIHKSGRQLTVGKPILKTKLPGAIMYGWSQEMKYESLSVDAITKSVMRTDVINMAKSQGQLLTEQEIEAIMNPQIDWNVKDGEETTEVPQRIKLVQTERNCWDVVLTEKERENLKEILDV